MQFQVYSKDNCKYCFSAIYLLEHHKLNYVEFKLGREFTRDELIEQFPEAQTFPQIKVKFEDGTIKNIGGYEDLSKFVKE